MDFSETAPEIAKEIYDIITEKIWLDKAEYRFDAACRLSISGDIIDFSVGLKLE